MFDYILIRVLFVLILGVSAAYFRPSAISLSVATGAGIALAIICIILENRVERVSLKRLIGMTAGTSVGLICSALVSLVLGRLDEGANPGLPLIQVLCLVLFVYFGAIAGAAKGDMLNLGAMGGVFGPETNIHNTHKILDTSVIIDGRIADIADTGFLDGVLVIPQFVLQELQSVADSADSMKRNRGRRGLDVLQRIQKLPNVKVQVVQEDFPNVKEVDMKLIELAKVYNCKIVTNDFNLNKVAHVRGVEVLNINELANALKPIVLPGELMRVFILKEGKEYNQGVAYLDDGTMVVVDNARRMISKTIDISVTSVLQTTAGKMIFGKFDERNQIVEKAPPPVAPQVAERADRPQRREHAVGES